MIYKQVILEHFKSEERITEICLEFSLRIFNFEGDEPTFMNEINTQIHKKKG